MTTSHLHYTMTAQDYIQSKLSELQLTLNVPKPRSNEELEAAIVKSILSKKFRKYAANDELITHIKNAVHINVENHEPINITFLHGAYKLWRLDEAPEPDWAELFSLMYYTNWMKPICELYEPGVWFDFFVDDLIIARIDNLPMQDILTYLQNYQGVIDFLKPYQPSNLKMTITPVGSRFPSEEAFDASVQNNLAKLTAGLPGGLPVLSESQWAKVDLNTKATDVQLKDPKWREKVYHLHNAYMVSKGETGYHKGRPDKIIAFTQPLPSGTALIVGTTKDSIAKFWVGVGALKPREDSYRQIILSPKQLSMTKFDWEDVDLGLRGKNFKKIRVLESK